MIRTVFVDKSFILILARAQKLNCNFFLSKENAAEPKVNGVDDSKNNEVADVGNVYGMCLYFLVEFTNCYKLHGNTL